MNIEHYNKLLTQVNQINLTRDDRIRGGVNRQMVQSVHDYHEHIGSVSDEQIRMQLAKCKISKTTRS